jgi:hypothetical protein
LLQLRHGQRRIVEIAFQQGRAGFERMHVPVDEAGHQEAPIQLHLDGRGTDVARERRVAADVENPSVAYRECAGAGIAGIGGEDDAVEIHTISAPAGRLGRLTRGNRQQQHCGQAAAHCYSHST